MGEVIAIGDAARLADGTIGKVISIEKITGLFVLEVGEIGLIVVRRRHEFELTKWEKPKVTATGIGVCAANSSPEVIF